MEIIYVSTDNINLVSKRVNALPACIKRRMHVVYTTNGDLAIDRDFYDRVIERIVEGRDTYRRLIKEGYSQEDAANAGLVHANMAPQFMDDGTIIDAGKYLCELSYLIKVCRL